MFGKLEIIWNKKYKRNLLEVSGYWFRVLMATEVFSSPFPHVGEDDL